jgi:hypothetical protein
MPIRAWKSSRPDDRRGNSETGAGAQHCASILGDVGLVKRQP